LKGLFTFILFLAFAFRPFYNVGFLAYYELNIDYIVETYCVNKNEPELKCNGKCHLAKKLNIDTNNSKSSAINSIFEAFIPLYFQEYKTHDFLQLTGVPIKKYWSYSNLYTSFNINVFSPPPEA